MPRPGTQNPPGGVPALHAASHAAGGSDPLDVATQPYTVADADDWSPTPTDPAGALDQLAARDALSRVVSPAAFAGDQDDVNFGAAFEVVRVELSAAGAITGMVPGRPKVIVNAVGGFVLTIKDHDAGSAAANQFSLPGGSDIAVPADGSVQCWYDVASTTWRVIGMAV